MWSHHTHTPYLTFATTRPSTIRRLLLPRPICHPCHRAEPFPLPRGLLLPPRQFLPVPRKSVSTSWVLNRILHDQHVGFCWPAVLESKLDYSEGTLPSRRSFRNKASTLPLSNGNGLADDIRPH
ncbi:hypothetical protein Y032_0299g1786 [Ancylostoma ceylanicum]|uniref:Uncharacterized protein n=1 Tax=Ancylostoma ceylanicum TaxID=53326 RepID=A0A016S3Z6_9BILA|nr:hypothetical protein Y032_0299g1786 [Ancylostoma ceylanicum]